MSDIAFCSATELMTAIRQCEISSRELLEHYLSRVERYDPELNAIVALDVERAGKRADAALARRSTRSIAWLSVTIKDTLETALWHKQ